MFPTKILKENILAYHTVPKSLILSLAVWTTLYFIIKKLSRQEPEWVVRMTTAVHASVVTILSVLDWSYIREWDIQKLGLLKELAKNQFKV